MVYGYKTNKEFVDKTYQLLEKLDKKGIWNKDTLIIGLDKSVRPLAYTIRKLSQEEGRPTPDIRFFNYSSSHQIDSIQLKKNVDKLNSEVESRNFSKYKEILLLDDHVYSGNSLKNAKKIISKVLPMFDNIKMVVLGTSTDHDKYLKKEDFIFVENNLPKKPEEKDMTGVEFKIGGFFPYLTGEKIIKISSKKEYAKFIQNRNQLRSDIINYVKEKHDEQENKKSNFLEKIVSMFSFVFVVAGLAVGFPNITGNVIGTSGAPNIVGIGLIVAGVVGLIISKKL